MLAAAAVVGAFRARRSQPVVLSASVVQIVCVALANHEF